MSRFDDMFGDRRVFLTGHTGFKGSWMALWLHRLGAQVTGYALEPPTEPSNFEASRVVEVLARHHEADVRDLDTMSAALEAADPEVIFHLAAQPIVRESYRDPTNTFESNMMGTVNLLESVRRWGKPCTVVVITSDKCYENQERHEAYVEDEPMGGHDPYSASKGAAELIAASYRRSYFPPARLADHGVLLATTRAGNVIGGGDWAPDRIVPDLARALAAGEPIPVRNADAVRPWQHVLEPLSGYLTIAAALLRTGDGELCTAWNFGPRPGDDITVGALVELAVETWGDGRWEHRVEVDPPHEARLLRLDITRAAQRLGWSPRWSVDTAVRRAMEWYRQFYAEPGTDMRQTCLDQIAAYESTVGALA